MDDDGFARDAAGLWKEESGGEEECHEVKLSAFFSFSFPNRYLALGSEVRELLLRHRFVRPVIILWRFTKEMRQAPLQHTKKNQ